MYVSEYNIRRAIAAGEGSAVISHADTLDAAEAADRAVRAFRLRRG